MAHVPQRLVLLDFVVIVRSKAHILESPSSLTVIGTSLLFPLQGCGGAFSTLRDAMLDSGLPSLAGWLGEHV